MYLKNKCYKSFNTFHNLEASGHRKQYQQQQHRHHQIIVGLEISDIIIKTNQPMSILFQNLIILNLIPVMIYNNALFDYNTPGLKL
jgi:hypothetical protein